MNHGAQARRRVPGQQWSNPVRAPYLAQRALPQGREPARRDVLKGFDLWSELERHKFTTSLWSQGLVCPALTAKKIERVQMPHDTWPRSSSSISEQPMRLEGIP